MSDPKQPRTPPKLPTLKRFANLDIDGPEGELAPRPQRPESKRNGRTVSAPASPAVAVRGSNVAHPTVSDVEVSDVEAAHQLIDELNDNARTSRLSASPATRREQRAAEIRGMRPPDPPLARGSRTGRIAVESALGPAGPTVRMQPMPPPARSSQSGRGGAGWLVEAVTLRGPEARLEGVRLEGATPGVIVEEIDLSRRGRTSPQAPGVSYGGLASDAALLTRAMLADADLSPPSRRSPARPAVRPVELTEMAARQVMLMAWEAGIPGSALRILTSSVGGLGRPEIDFAFDEHCEPDDHVFESFGVTIVVDPASLTWVGGRRITWHEVPGSEGFALSR